MNLKNIHLKSPQGLDSESHVNDVNCEIHDGEEAESLTSTYGQLATMVWDMEIIGSNKLTEDKEDRAG